MSEKVFTDQSGTLVVIPSVMKGYTRFMIKEDTGVTATHIANEDLIELYTFLGKIIKENLP